MSDIHFAHNGTYQSNNINQHWHVPYARNEYFTGREEILRRTHKLLTKQQVVALHGLGGMGKTQTAVEYVYAHRNEYTAILWLNADSVAAFNHSLGTVAQVLGIEQQQQDEILKAVNQWLTTHAGWLLIADNADDLDIVKAFVSAIKAYGRVLLTTRAKTIRPVAMPVEVVPLTVTEGTRFLYQRREIANYQQQADYAQAYELVRLMDGLPLALEQAAAYIDENQCTLAEYLALYQRYEQQLLAERGQLAYDNDHPLPVAVTWQASFDKIRTQNPQTLAILDSCAFLSSDGIPEEILWLVFTDYIRLEYLNIFARFWFYVKRSFNRYLQRYQFVKQLSREAEEKPIGDFKATFLFVQQEFRNRFRYTVAPLDEFQFQQLIKPALAYSLLKRDVDQQRLFIHRLVQVVLRGALSEKVQRRWIERLIAVACDLFPDPKSIENWPTCQRLVSSALACAKGIVQYQLASEMAGILLNRTAYYLEDKADYTVAQPLYEHSLAIWEKVLGTYHPDVAPSLNNLAQLYRAQGQYDQAQLFYERALAIFTQKWGEQHPHTQACIRNYQDLLEKMRK